MVGYLEIEKIFDEIRELEKQGCEFDEIICYFVKGGKARGRMSWR